ncbi:MAG: NAD(+) diphosphatase [Pseudomonadota bacterium]
MQDQNVFAGAFVDRAGERRKDPEWLADAVNAQKSVFLPVWGDRCLVNTDAPACRLLPYSDVRDLVDHEELIFLGLFRDEPVFAFVVSRDQEPPFAELGEYKDLRSIGTELPADDANLAAHARALVLWHQSQLHCGLCGSKASSHAAGNARRCTNCDNTMFPRVDPAVIVLVSIGDRCLLGRQTTWPEGRYSTIAGFVEPGESLEDAVRREVFEETNIHVGDVHYHSSQPWPFPSSLMLGFHAEGLSDDIVLNDAELEDARWFTRDELRSEFPKLPFRISIARRLVDHWLHAGEN